MTAFRWAMRRGAPILFVASLLILVISFGNYYFLQGAAYGQSLYVSDMMQAKMLLLWGALAQALEYAAWPFVGACLVDRADRYLAGKGAAQ